MKTNKLLRSFFIGCSLFAATALSAQTLVTSWEAENFVGNGFQVDANNIPIVVSAGHSGGKFVQRISQSQSLLYYVNVATAGVYDLKMFYMIQAAAAQIGTKIGVRVNNQFIRGTEVTEFTAADNSTTPASITFPIYLDAGINLIRIGKNGSWSSGYAPNFDYFELYTSTAILEKPADDTPANIAGSLTPFIEAGDFTRIPGIFKVAVAGGNPTAANLIDNNPATEFVSNNEIDTIVISYPSTLCTFMLRGIASTNPYVVMGGIERSLDSITWDATTYRSHALFDMNKTVAYSTAAFWNATADPTITTNFTDYKYYRFTVRKPSWEAQLRIEDLKICGSLQSYVDLTEAANGTQSIEVTGAVDGTNGVNNAFDNSISSKCSYNTSSFKISYTFTDSARVNAYLITTAGSPAARNAKAWVFEGSTNGTTYVQLDSVSGFVWANERRATYLTKIQSPGIYKIFRLRVKEKQGADTYLHLGEVQLFGELKSSIVTNVSTPDQLSLNVYSANNQIVLKANVPTPYQIFDVAGRLIKRGHVNATELSVQMSKGLYLVKIADKVTKVIVQ